MSPWVGLVLAVPRAGREEMASRLPTYLHPVAGRPLIWHTVAALVAADPAPQRVLVVSEVELPGELFHDIGGRVEVLPPHAEESLEHLEGELSSEPDAHLLLVPGTALPDPRDLARLLAEPDSHWLQGPDGDAVAAWIAPPSVGPALRLPDPFDTPNGVLADPQRLAGEPATLVVRSREHLALVSRAVRDRLVRQLMGGGATFLLPESVLVDVDVRLGRDSVIYPGAVLEGQTTVGEETVVGPGCRIISSWIGSGVELKGWNYIANTSVRNRAILEPYVRRGYD